MATADRWMEAGLAPTPDNLLAQSDSERADVALAAAGDQSAFERLYRLHAAKVHSLVRRMVASDTDADELTQDVFVRVWQRLSSYRGDAAFGTWLHRLAVNLVINWQRSASRSHRLFADDAGVELTAAPHRSPESVMDLEDALVLLPAGARQVLVLHDVEGYRHEEIAGLLGVTTGTTKAQLHRARMLMRGHLER